MSYYNMTYSDKVLLASTLCCALYGNTSNLKHILDDTVGLEMCEYDMVFMNVLDSNRFLIINHDSLDKHVAINSLLNDRRQVSYAMYLNHIFIRHRHVECPTLDIVNNNFHLLEYDSDCGVLSKYIINIASAILNHILNERILSYNDNIKNTQRFLENPFFYEEMSVRGAERYIKNLTY